MPCRAQPQFREVASLLPRSGADGLVRRWHWRFGNESRTLMPASMAALARSSAGALLGGDAAQALRTLRHAGLVDGKGRLTDQGRFCLALYRRLRARTGCTALTMPDDQLEDAA